MVSPSSEDKSNLARLLILASGELAYSWSIDSSSVSVFRMLIGNISYSGLLRKYFCHWKGVMSQFGRSYVTIIGRLDKALWGIEDA